MNPPRRLLTIVLDSPCRELLDRWSAEGRLPAWTRLREGSRRFELSSTKQFSNEHCWIPFLTGRRRERWDHWLDQWDPRTYEFREASIFDWLQAPMFYALGDRCRVIAFDLTAPIVDSVAGVQVAGWASELNEAFPATRPAELQAQLMARHGPDPKLSAPQSITNAVSRREGVSYVIPSLYDGDAMAQCLRGQIRSVQRRTDACLALMRDHAWDLCLVQFSEVHTAGHLLWHLSQPHPLAVLRRGGTDPLLQVYEAVDAAVGRLVATLQPQDAVALLTMDAMAPDCLENARAALLPEFMYRWNFGHAALAPGDADAPVPPLRLDWRRHWKHEVWDLRTAAGEARLESPRTQEARGDPLSWCPANWYAPVWPAMRAFALPSVADGCVRLNVAGRERLGQVTTEAFAATCAEIEAALRELVDPRTGRRVVREVIRVREHAMDDDPAKPPADLIVVCQAEGPIDAVQSARVGRIGPLPYFRTGAHDAHGVALRNVLYTCAPGLAPGDAPGTGALEDIGPTLLDLLGIAPATRMDGVSLLAR